MQLDTAATPLTCTWYDSTCATPNEVIADSCEIPGAIHIVPDNCVGGEHHPGDDNAGGVISIKTTVNGAGLDVPYEHFFLTDGAATAFGGLLMHELGHGLTVAHPHECGDSSWPTICPAGAEGSCAIMHGTLYHERAHEFYLPDDVAALRQLFGYRIAPSERHFESSNLVNGVVEHSLINVSLEGFSASSAVASASPSSTTFLGYHRSSAVGRPQVYSWDWSTFNVTSLGTLSTHTSNGPLAAAQSSVYRFAVSNSFRLGSTSRRWHRRVTSSYRPLSSGTWATQQANPASGTPGDTRTGGIGAAYDSVSSAVLYAYRTTQGQVVLQAGTTGTPYVTGWYSRSTPSIACSPASGLNCIAVTTEPGGDILGSTDLQRLQWFRFSYNGVVGFTTSALTTEPWILWNGGSQAAVYRNGSANEYVVGYMQSLGATTYIWILRMPEASSSFTFWGGLATTTEVPTHLAMGATRDLEMYLFSN